MALLHQAPLRRTASLPLPPAPVAHPLTLQHTLHLPLPHQYPPAPHLQPHQPHTPHPYAHPPAPAPRPSPPISVAASASAADSDRDIRLEKAVALVNNSKYSVRKAAQALSLPKSTVHRYLQATRSESLPGVSKRPRRLSSGAVGVYRELARSRSVGYEHSYSTDRAMAHVAGHRPGKCDIAFLLEGASAGSTAGARDEETDRARDFVAWNGVEVVNPPVPVAVGDDSPGRNLRRIWA